jgi:hypothetical protein
MEFKNFLIKDFQTKLLKIFECCGKNFNKVWNKEILPVIFETKYNNKEQLVDLILEKVIVLKEELSDTHRKYIDDELLGIIKPEFIKELKNAGKIVQNMIHQKVEKEGFDDKKATHALLAISQLYAHLATELNNFDSSKVKFTAKQPSDAYFSRYHPARQKWKEEQKSNYDARHLGHVISGGRDEFGLLINRIADEKGKTNSEVKEDIVHQLISKGRIEGEYEDYRGLFDELIKYFEKGKLVEVRKIIKNYLSQMTPSLDYPEELKTMTSEKKPMISPMSHAST